MNPKTFPEANVIFAENQPEYLPLPAYKQPDDINGRIVTLWELSEAELLEIQKTKSIFIEVLTFNLPLQPIRPYIKDFLIQDIQEDKFHKIADNSVGFREFLDSIDINYIGAGHFTLIDKNYNIDELLTGLQAYKILNP